MYKLESLSLTNYHLWHDLEFKFEPGLTFVSGRNRSGKSLLFSSIPSILYDTDPVPSNARATLSLSNAAHEYSFTAFNRSSARNKFELSIDGRDQQTETISAARNLIDEHFCQHLQYALFETTVSVSGLEEHPLAKKGSKPSQRLDWIHETLAYANVFDSYLDSVERQLKSTRDDAVRYTLLRDQLSKLEVVEKPDDNADTFKQQLVDLSAQIRKLEEKERLIEQALNTESDSVKEPDMSLKDAQSKLSRAEKTLSEQRRLKPLFESYESDLEQYTQHQQKKEAAKVAYKEACDRVKIKAKNPSTVDLSDDLEALKRRIKDASKNNSLYEQQTEARELANSDREPVYDNAADFKKKITQLREKITIASSQIKFIEGDSKHCPMCGSSKSHVHDKAALLEEKTSATKQLSALEKDYAVWTARQTEFVDWIDIEKIEKRIRLLEAVQRAASNYVALVDRDIEKPERVDFYPAVLKKAKQQVERYSNAVIEAKAFEQSKKIVVPTDNKFIGKNKKALKALLAETRDQLRTLNTDSAKISDAMINAKTNKALYARYKQARQELIEAAKPLKQANSDNRLLQLAKKGLGRDGFRVKRLNQTLELFVSNLNEFAPLIWDEPFKFEVDIGKRKCEVVAHRNNKHGSTATFSGSEKRCWQALAALSMLRLLPSNRRCDTIILDELDANMDMPGRAKLIQDFIPELQKTVDKVIVVSPLTKKELGINPDRGFLVEKRRAKSQLITL